MIGVNTRSGLMLDGVGIALEAHRLVPPLEFAIAPGERVTVMGPSGSGKSTLLAYIAGTLEPAFTAEGRVSIDGDDVTDLAPERRRVGILFQDDLLFPHLSVGDRAGARRGRAAQFRPPRSGDVVRRPARAGRLDENVTGRAPGAIARRAVQQARFATAPRFPALRVRACVASRVADSSRHARRCGCGRGGRARHHARGVKSRDRFGSPKKDQARGGSYERHDRRFSRTTPG
jgi:ABC-type Fe3+/spermidine/putrescine transport system ATPase subunit